MKKRPFATLICEKRPFTIIQSSTGHCQSERQSDVLIIPTDAAPINGAPINSIPVNGVPIGRTPIYSAPINGFGVVVLSKIRESTKYWVIEPEFRGGLVERGQGERKTRAMTYARINLDGGTMCFHNAAGQGQS